MIKNDIKLTIMMLLNIKIDEIYKTVYEELDIKYGDITPLQSNELNKKIVETAQIMTSVIQGNLKVNKND